MITRPEHHWFEAMVSPGMNGALAHPSPRLADARADQIAHLLLDRAVGREDHDTARPGHIAYT
jgi:hypothetical protein